MDIEISSRKLEIIETAGRLLIEKGVKGLTTKNLANKIGFSESALYRHFKSKEDVIVFLLDYLLANIIERLELIVCSKISSKDKLKLIFESQFNYFNDNPHFIVAILSEGLFDDSEKINASIIKIVTYKTEVISSIIEQAKANNELKNEIPTQDMVHIIIGSFRLMMLKWKLSKFKLNLISQGNNLIKTNIKLMSI